MRSVLAVLRRPRRRGAPQPVEPVLSGGFRAGDLVAVRDDTSSSPSTSGQPWASPSSYAGMVGVVVGAADPVAGYEIEVLFPGKGDHPVSFLARELVDVS